MAISIKNGDNITTLPLLVERWTELYIVCTSVKGVSVSLPLWVDELKLGMAGADAFIHPTELPPSSPAFVTWHDKAKSLVLHRGDIYSLQLKSDFSYSGNFLLARKDGTSLIKTSTQYSQKTFRQHMQSFVGLEMTFEFVVRRIYNNKKSEVPAAYVSHRDFYFLLTTKSNELLLYLPSRGVFV